MQIFDQIFKKGNRTIFTITFLMFVMVIAMNYHNYKKSLNETNIKNLINNVYFKKSLGNLFNQFNPKYERVYHNVLKGQSLSNIFDKYSLNKNELELVKKSLVKKYKITSLKINDLLEFTIDRSNQKITEFSYPVSKTKKIYLSRTKDFKFFNDRIITTKLLKQIKYEENIIMNSLYKSALDSGIPDSIIVEFARIYGFEIDFQRDIRKKDSFQIMYEVFKNEDYLPKLTSTKSLTGHSLGATGVHEAIYTLIMMNNNFISGSANITDDDPEIGAIDIPRKTIKDIEINLALSNSFGFGGTNACLALSKLI